jgi:TnpA family transposase
MDFEGDVPVTDRESGKWDNMILQKVALNIDNEVKIDITQRLTKQELEQIKKTLV